MSITKNIKINVGGVLFTTTKTTLEGSRFFRNLFSFSPDCIENGEFFIDRDPEHFKYVLSYLRDVNYASLFPSALTYELDFFGVYVNDTKTTTETEIGVSNQFSGYVSDIDIYKHALTVIPESHGLNALRYVETVIVIYPSHYGEGEIIFKLPSDRRFDVILYPMYEFGKAENADSATVYDGKREIATWNRFIPAFPLIIAYTFSTIKIHFLKKDTTTKFINRLQLAVRFYHNYDARIKLIRKGKTSIEHNYKYSDGISKKINDVDYEWQNLHDYTLKYGEERQIDISTTR